MKFRFISSVGIKIHFRYRLTSTSCGFSYKTLIHENEVFNSNRRSGSDSNLKLINDVRISKDLEVSENPRPSMNWYRRWCKKEAMARLISFRKVSLFRGGFENRNIYSYKLRAISPLIKEILPYLRDKWWRWREIIARIRGQAVTIKEFERPK